MGSEKVCRCKRMKAEAQTKGGVAGVAEALPAIPGSWTGRSPHSADFLSSG
jgi:hypothetical protein